MMNSELHPMHSAGNQQATPSLAPGGSPPSNMLDAYQNDLIAAEIRRMQQAREEENNSLMNLLSRQRQQQMQMTAGDMAMAGSSPAFNGSMSMNMPSATQGQGGNTNNNAFGCSQQMNNINFMLPQAQAFMNNIGMSSNNNVNNSMMGSLNSMNNNGLRMNQAIMPSCMSNMNNHITSSPAIPNFQGSSGPSPSSPNAAAGGDQQQCPSRTFEKLEMGANALRETSPLMAGGNSNNNSNTCNNFMPLPSKKQQQAFMNMNNNQGMENATMESSLNTMNNLFQMNKMNPQLNDAMMNNLQKQNGCFNNVGSHMHQTNVFNMDGMPQKNNGFNNNSNNNNMDNTTNTIMPPSLFQATQSSPRVSSSAINKLPQGMILPPNTSNNNPTTSSTLTSQGDPGWEEQCKSLRAYHLQFGNCRVPARFKSDPKLGRWVMTQRRQFTLLMQGLPSALTADRIRRLESLGFTWSVRPEPVTTWNKKLAELKAYKATYGNCVVPQRFTANPQLGTWVHTQRRQYKLMFESKKSSMTREKMQALDSIKFDWDAKHVNTNNTSPSGSLSLTLLQRKVSGNRSESMGSSSSRESSGIGDDDDDDDGGAASNVSEGGQLVSRVVDIQA